MRTTPFAIPGHFSDRIKKDPADAQNEFWFIFDNSKLLVDQCSKLPFQEKMLPLKHSLYMGTFNNCHVHTGIVDSQTPPPGAIWEELRKLYGKIDDDLLALAGRASQLVLWERTHQFCGQCGSKTSQREHERAKECSSCKLISFPKISPVIIVLIERGEELLLAKGTHSATGFYSALAGFVEPGETLEQCVKREVREEVGLEVDQIQYFGSQSWPFPNSLMIAFTCKWRSGEIKIDPSEIADARWFTVNNLPLLPPDYSISRILIDSCTTNHG